MQQNGRILGPQAGRLVAAALIALVTIYLTANAGGFFAGAPGVAATALGLVLVLRISIAEDPFAGFSRSTVAASVALGLGAAWALVSSQWSNAPAQAMIEFDRALLYWLGLVLFASLPHDRRTLSLALRLMAATIFGIALVALLTRILPDVWSATAEVANDRLSFPLTYWNALGVLVSVGLVFCVHMSAATDGSRLVRVLAAAALPTLATTLYFTFSRGAIAAAGLGLLAYVLVVRPRGILSVAVAAAPIAGLIIYCYHAELLSSGAYATPEGVSQGHAVGLAVLLTTAAVVAIRLAFAGRVDERVGAAELPALGWRWATAACVGALAVAVAGAVIVDLPDKLANQYEQFADERAIDDSGDLRGRLTDVSNNGRLAQWRVAWEAFASEPVTGEGAGTFARVWARNADIDLKVEDAHSLYLELLAELGLPGLILIGGTVAILVAGLGVRARGGPDRAIFGALFAAGLVWGLHAGTDWDWEMPATGFWLFAFGGLALSRAPGPSSRRPGRTMRLVLSIGCLALVVTPALMALSQLRLNQAVEAFRGDDCTQASAAALKAARLVPARPEPFQILAYCNSRAGEHDLAIRMSKAAISRDPERWDSYYGLAVTRGAAGEDPRPAAREALNLSPRSALAQEAVAEFETTDPDKWRRRATAARLPIF